MEYSENNIVQIVNFINEELSKGRTMIDIENKDFNVNERVITKRLNRKGYTKVNNKFTLREGLEHQEINYKAPEEKERNVMISNNITPKYNIDINQNVDKLEELINLLEPIKEVIEKYNKSKAITGVTTELKTKNTTKVKQKLFKVDVEVLKEWEKFVVEHKQFKVQNLISLALEEFINKYK